MSIISKSLACCAITLLLGLSVIAQQESEQQKGIRLYREGAFTESASILKEVVKSSPSNAAWKYLGAALVNSGIEKEAIEAFKNSGQFKFNKDDEMVDKQRRITKPSKPDKLEVGWVKVAAELRKDGTVGFVVPIDADASKAYIESCLKATRKMKFEAAEIAGQPVTSVMTFEYSSR